MLFLNLVLFDIFSPQFLYLNFLIKRLVNNFDTSITIIRITNNIPIIIHVPLASWVSPPIISASRAYPMQPQFFTKSIILIIMHKAWTAHPRLYSEVVGNLAYRCSNSSPRYSVRTTMSSEYAIWKFPTFPNTWWA